MLAALWTAAALLVPSTVLIWGWLAALPVVALMVQVRGLTQHGLTDRHDALLSSRTVRPHPVVAFLLFNENYHLEHHLFPEVPSYHLPALHRAAWDHLPRTCEGTSYLGFLGASSSSRWRWTRRRSGWSTARCDVRARLGEHGDGRGRLGPPPPRFAAPSPPPRWPRRGSCGRRSAPTRDTTYGRAHGVEKIQTLAQFQERVPIVGWDEVAPYVDRIAAGEARAPTAEPVRLLETDRRLVGRDEADSLHPDAPAADPRGRRALDRGSVRGSAGLSAWPGQLVCLAGHRPRVHGGWHPGRFRGRRRLPVAAASDAGPRHAGRSEHAPPRRRPGDVPLCDALRHLVARQDLALVSVLATDVFVASPPPPPRLGRSTGRRP